MPVSIPGAVRKTLRERVWHAAESARWENLSNAERSRLYEQWLQEDRIGGVLENYIDRAQIRVYLKDTLLKGYTQSRLDDAERVLRILRIVPPASVIRKYRKPHGRLLNDGRLITWGRADDWRPIIFASYERRFTGVESTSYAVLLLNAGGRFEGVKQLAHDLALRLEVERVLWIE